MPIVEPRTVLITSAFTALLLSSLAANPQEDQSLAIHFRAARG